MNSMSPDLCYAASRRRDPRFDDAMRKEYRCTPSPLCGRSERSPSIAVRLPYRPPFRFDAIARFLADRDQMPPVTIEPDKGNALRMILPASGARAIHELVERARRTFDLTVDPLAIAEHLCKDSRLRPLLAKRPGPRVPGAWNPMTVAIRGIVGQQISVQAATTIMRRGDFTKGMPQSRIDTIRRFQQAVASDPSLLERGASLEESIDRLIALKGIGPWTAHYIAMRVLNEPDAFPHSDLGLRKAAALIGIENLLAHAERWRPYRAYAAIALWESL